MSTSWTNKNFVSHDLDGTPNGYIDRIWEEDVELPGYRPKQVYATAIAPGAMKGPHLHKRRDSLFCCVSGAVRILTRNMETGEIKSYISGDESTSGPVSVHVPAGTACVLENLSTTAGALLINLSSGHYDPADEHPVEDFR